MEKSDALKREDQVTVTIYNPDGSPTYQTSGTGFHSIEAAISEAIGGAGLKVNPEDCVFKVSNDTTGVSHRYRINAHGNLKLIV